MADGFDPYHRWLGIPPHEQPPHHYRLLGVSLWEDDAEVIRDATQQRMAHVRTYQLGAMQALSQQILNELGAAKACLSDPPQKATYDAQLRQKLAQPLKAPVPELIKRIGNARLELFVQHLIQSGLFSAEEVASYYGSLPADKQPQDAASLARELFRAGKLSKYQAQMVYDGRIKGLVFGEYRVVEKLGEGGMGVVLKAEHQLMERTVAVKMIARAAMKSPDAVKRFYREVKAAGKLMHSNIVAAHDAGEYDGGHYLVMEYIEGKDLGALVREKGRLPIARVCDYILQAARGLQYAHEQGIVHRDIKPANLMVDSKGTVKILDMGLARIAGHVDEGDSDRLTSSDMAMGTCDYMAPEQAIDTHQVDARADICALGCTLYRLLAGEAMYKGETIAKVLIAHQMAPIPSLRASRPEVSPQLDAVYQKMVAKKPEERYQSMSEVIAVLEACAGQAGTISGHGDESAGGFPLDGELSFLRRATGRSGTPVPDKADVRHGVPDLRQANLWRKKPLWIALGAAGAGIIVMAIIIRVRRPDGTEQVSVVPDGSQVTISQQSNSGSARPQGGKVAAGNGALTSPLRALSEAWSGEGSGVRAPRPPGAARSEGFAVPAAALGGGPGARARSPAGRTPPLAKPSMSAAEAAQIQKQWADHLGLPLETTNSIGMKLVLIPPGEFDMGSTPEQVDRELEESRKTGIEKWYLERVPTETPRHRVRISKPFYLGIYPVTQTEYEQVMGFNPSTFTARPRDKSAFDPPLTISFDKTRSSAAKKMARTDTSRHPVDTVNWGDTVEFCRKLSAVPGERAARRVYRLPTEAEWEYACRAGTTTRWYCGDDEASLDQYGWFKQNSGGTTHRVGEKKPNVWGLFDMFGNVFQWCADRFHADYYKQSPSSDPPGPSDGPGPRINRGGAWAKDCTWGRSAYRNICSPTSRGYLDGFRVVVARGD